jgi:hypothetical protein
MRGLIKIVLLVWLSLAGLLFFTNYDHDRKAGLREARTTIAGYPVIAIAQKQPRGLIAVGQVNAVGVVTIAQLGWGLIGFNQGGAGLIFGLGQGSLGLVVIAQGGLGLFFFLGQMGLGINALGQGVFRFRGWDLLKEMSAEFSALLAWRGE